MPYGGHMPRDTLTRGQIVNAAIDLLDAEGHEGLNMRALGQRLGSAATAVYWHVGSKDNLIALAADQVWSEIARPDPAVVGWRAAAAAMATDLYATLTRHPWLAQAFGSQLLYGPGKARHDDHGLAIYEAAGFTGAQADQAAVTVLTFVLGHALGAAAGPPGHGRGRVRRVARGQLRVWPAGHPRWPAGQTGQPPVTHLPPMTRLLLVHSPLVGPASWDLIAPALAEPAREVTIPDLTSTVAAGPPWCSRQAELIARAAAGRPAALVGHSGAGPLLAAAGAMIPQVRGYVFVDAGLPIPGQTWMDTAPPELAAQLREMVDPDGWLPPWPRWWGEEALAELLPDPGTRVRFIAGCPPLPLAMFAETHPLAPRWPDAPCAYLRLSEAYEDQAARAAGLGWPVTRLASHHLALLTDPAVVAEAIGELLCACRIG